MLFIAMGLASGCFYTDPLNQRPSVGIAQKPDGPVYRGSMVHLLANTSDPEGSFVRVQWRAYACTDPTVHPDASHPGCDTDPFHTDFQDSFDFTVPTFRAGTTTPVQAVLVLLEGQDDLDAAARPVQQLILELDDKPPTVTASTPFRTRYVVDTAVDVFAAIGDPDDGIAPPPMIGWAVFTPPAQPAYELVDIANVPPDPLHPELLELGKTFTPHGIGAFDIEVTATDALGMAATADVPFEVDADHPPCLAQLAPIVPPAGETLPLDQPTLFQVLVVDDDLDVYPPSGDPVDGVTTFSWSLLPPGGTTRVPLSTATGNRVLLDPASYRLGDILELRVEIQDRIPRAIDCPADRPTCSLSGDTCIQRQTWRVEVR